MNQERVTRRAAMGAMAAGVAAAYAPAVSTASETRKGEGGTLKGNVKHSACMWCYNSLWRDSPEGKERFVKACADMGLVGVDLVGADDWPLLKKYGLVATMAPGAGGIVKGLNDRANHKECMEQFRKNIPATAKEGFKNVITFSGSRAGKSDEEGWDACREILEEAVKIAEDEGVTICMELLNSKVDHPDYQCDKTPWGVELCKRVDSPRFKLLYDIYHMQIMEGDVIRTIRDSFEHIAHFHTGGVPGRHEIDETQELYYPAIMRAIVDLGYEGYVAQEFIPARDPLESLKQGVEICDV